MNAPVILNHLDTLVAGLWMTSRLTFISVLFGLIIALPLSVARTSTIPWLSVPIRLYVYLFRGTPLLVQMFLIYYGVGQSEWARQSVLWPMFKEAYFCALLALTLNTVAYTTEILRGGLKTVPKELIESATALGLSRLIILRKIIFPITIRHSLPAYSNEVIMMLQASSLASVITLMDLTGVARMINARYYSPFEAFLPVAALYFLLTFGITRCFKFVETKLSYKD